MIYKLYLKYLKYRKPIEFARKIGVKIGKDCRLIDVEFSTEPYLVSIGNHVSATKTRFETHDGAVWVFRESEPDIDMIGRIDIEDNVYIGYGAIILPGTKIGANTIIGAHSLVKGELEAGYVYAGTPIRKICSVKEYYQKNAAKFTKTKNLSDKDKKDFLKKNIQ